MDILVNSTGTGTLGRTAQIKEVNQPISVDTHVTIVRPNNKVDKKFIGFQLALKEPEIISLGKGATNQQELGRTELGGIELLLPPLPTQRKIASILSAYDDLIENNLKRIKLLEEIAQRTYEQWFVKFCIDGKQLKLNKETGLPEGWERKKLGELADFKYGKMPKAALISEIGYPIYSGYRITGYYPDFTINEPAIIIVARGVGGTGDVKISPRKCWLTNLSIEILPKADLVCKYFLYFKLKNENMRSLDSGAAQSQITIVSLTNYQIIFPKNELQDRFELFYKEIAQQKECLQNQNRLLKESRDILLPRLMSGVIDMV